MKVKNLTSTTLSINDMKTLDGNLLQLNASGQPGDEVEVWISLARVSSDLQAALTAVPTPLVELTDMTDEESQEMGVTPTPTVADISNVSGRVSAEESARAGADGVLSGRADALEAADGVLSGRADALEAADGVLSGRADALEAQSEAYEVTVSAAGGTQAQAHTMGAAAGYVVAYSVAPSTNNGIFVEITKGTDTLTVAIVDNAGVAVDCSVNNEVVGVVLHKV